MKTAPDIAAFDDGSGVGFEWNTDENCVWMDWNDDGSISVYWRKGKEREEKVFQPGDGHGMCEFLSRAFEIVEV